jgi:hypothetical protein
MSNTELQSQHGSLTANARKLATELLAEESVAIAKKAASSLSGIVITNGEEAGRVSDLTKAVKTGNKRLKESLQEVVKPFTDAEKEARDTVRETMDTLTTAEKSGRSALDAWQAEQDRLVREERRKRQEECDRISREQAEAVRVAREAAEAEAEHITEETGVLVEPKAVDVSAIVPPLEIPVPEPEIIRGSASSSGKKKTLNSELYDASKCPWLVLDNKAAEAAFRKTPLIEGATQLDDDSIVWNGVRFYYTTSTVIR